MNFTTIDGVTELKWAQTYFIQVLLKSFRIDRTGDVSHLNVEFSHKSAALTRRITVENIRKSIPDFNSKSTKYQELFDSLLLTKSLGSIVHCDKAFPFRYASGGTLPIVIVDGKEYYCFFYRDVFPVGWNIANGGCDSITELLSPSITVTRELAEELIVISPKRKQEYIYRDDDNKVMSRPEFEIAREQWQSYLFKLDLKHFDQQEAPIEWIDGPDQLFVTLASERNEPLIGHPTSGYFLNVTAQDFSIEIDKVAKIAIENDVMLLDGEISDNKIRCRPIGLFDIQKTEKKVMNNERSFFPDILYYLGTPFVGSKKKLGKMIIEKNISRLIKSELRKPDHIKRIRSLEYPFDLCPITSRMIKRYVNYRKSVSTHGDSKSRVFLSHATRDSRFVQKLFDDLTHLGIDCFKAPESLRCGQNLLKEIYKGISKSDKFLIVVSRNSLESGWVKDEVNEAIRLDNKEGKITILPIQIDDEIFESEKPWARRLLNSHIQDFRNWNTDNMYKNALTKLVKELRTKKGAQE